MTNRELEIEACKTFVYPNLDIIDKVCKYEISPDMIEQTRQLAIEYITKTYHHPKYSSIRSLLPAFLFIALNIETNEKGEKIIRKEHRNLYSGYYSQKFCGFLFGVSGSTVRNWINKITEELDIQY